MDTNKRLNSVALAGLLLLAVAAGSIQLTENHHAGSAGVAGTASRPADSGQNARYTVAGARTSLAEIDWP